MILSQFHFLRPEWLLALVPVAVLIAHVRRTKSAGQGSDWANHVDAHLLRHLTVRDAQSGGGRGFVAVLATALIASVLALAGPTWQKQPVPAFQPQTPSVIVLSLAQSMNSADLVPSRLARAGHKLRDMLDRAEGEDTALVIYADQPFVAAPLTSDGAVIRQMLPELSTSLMPVLGNRLDLAIAEAQGLLERAGATQGRIVVLADDTGLDGDAAQTAAAVAYKAGFTVNVLGVGTADGAKLQTAQGRAIQTSDGQDVTVKVDEDGLKALAAAGGGAFSLITAGDTDLDQVFADQSNEITSLDGLSDRTGDSWLDMGYFLLFIPLLLAPFAFRRGLLIALTGLLLTGVLAPSGAQAGVWDDLWKTPDQQAKTAFEAEDFGRAASLFTTPDRQGDALYRQGEFARAAKAFAGSGYNKGNALAKSGAFEDALASYDDWIDANPDDADAIFNRDLVAKLLKDQQEQEQQEQQEGEQEQDGQGGGEKSDQPQDGQGQSDDAGDPQDQAGEPQSGKGDPSESSDDQATQEGEPQPGDGPGEDQQQSQSGGEAAQEPSEDQNGEAQEKSDQQGSPSKPSTDDGQGADQADPESEQQAGSKPSDQQGTEASDIDQTEAPDSEGNSFSEMMDRLLGDPQEAEGEAADPSGTATAALPALNQSAEQQLRRVPDDPSGLLRARIRQHYARQRATN